MGIVLSPGSGRQQAAQSPQVLSGTPRSAAEDHKYSNSPEREPAGYKLGGGDCCHWLSGVDGVNTTPQTALASQFRVQPNAAPDLAGGGAELTAKPLSRQGGFRALWEGRLNLGLSGVCQLR